MKALKYVLGLILLVSSLTAFAQGSGLYKDPDRYGEGISLTLNGNKVQFFFYTYDGNPGCFDEDDVFTVTIPEDFLVTNENCHENRWFLSGGDTLDESGVATGWFYTAFGLNYPEGLDDNDNPFQMNVGETQIVGVYVIERYDDGWRLVVTRWGDVLHEDDPLFERVYYFRGLIFAPGG
jgi:hypothetical protein